jgi:hypothetical protein
MTKFEKCVERDSGGGELHFRVMPGPCEGKLSLRVNPFKSEIQGNDTPEWLCDKHYHDWADEI